MNVLLTEKVSSNPKSHGNSVIAQSLRATSRWSILFALVLAVTFAASSTARADSYGFSFSGGGLSGSGIITVSPIPVPGVPGAYQITGVTGTFSDTIAGITNAAITGLETTPLPTGIDPIDGTFVPPGVQPLGFSYDNLFYPGGISPAVCPPPLPGDPHPPYPFGGGFFDIYGMLFDVEGGYTVDLWSNGTIPGFGLTYGVGDALNGVKLNTYGEPFSGTNVAVTTTPEPSSLLLLGTGILGFAGSVKRSLNARAKSRNS